MEDAIVIFETAELAKNKGFSGFCNGYFYKDTGEVEPFYCYYSGGLRVEDYSDSLCCQAPTQSLLQKWLRENHHIRVFVTHGISGNFNYEIRIFDKPNDVGKWTRIGHISSFDTYELALEEGLQQSLKLINNASDNKES